jgi:hypothetical protein
LALPEPNGRRRRTIVSSDLGVHAKVASGLPGASIAFGGACQLDFSYVTLTRERRCAKTLRNGGIKQYQPDQSCESDVLHLLVFALLKLSKEAVLGGTRERIVGTFRVPIHQRPSLPWSQFGAIGRRTSQCSACAYRIAASVSPVLAYGWHWSRGLHETNRASFAGPGGTTLNAGRATEPIRSAREAVRTGTSGAAATTTYLYSVQRGTIVSTMILNTTN